MKQAKVIYSKIRKQKIRSKKYLSFWVSFAKISLNGHLHRLNLNTHKPNLQYKPCYEGKFLFALHSFPITLDGACKKVCSLSCL